jgi:WhiB family redox-sensing transcriptional regulator
MADISWMVDGVCREVDAEMFFPDVAPFYADSRSLCDGCTVKNQCLKYELAHMLANPDDGTHGMWGGTTPPERHRLVAGMRARQRGALVAA